LPYRCPQAVVKMGTQTPLDVQSLRASKKVLVTGPILKKSDMQKFKRFLNDEAGKSGAVDRVDVESLPDTFLLPELKGDDKVAVIASVLFKGATGPAKFIAECNGQVYDDYSAMAVMRVNEQESLQELLQAAGEDPDFEHEDYVYAVVCGVFVPSIADIPLIVDKMKEVVPYTNCRYVNLTDKHSLEKVSGKSSYAFCLEYEYSSDTAKAKKLYPSALEELGGPEITILRRKENVGNADLLHEVPEELRVYSEPVSEEVLEAEAQPEGPFIIKIKGLKLKEKSVTQIFAYFQEKLQPFGQLGCDKACGQCITCQTPIKIKTDASLVGYFDCYNAILAASKGLHGKHTTFGVMQAILVKTEDEGDDEETEPEAGAASAAVLENVANFTACDVVVYLPKFNMNHAANEREFEKIVKAMTEFGEIAKQDVFFPNADAPMSQQEVIFFSRFVKAEDATKALKDFKINAFNRDLKVSPGSKVKLSHYQLESFENDDNVEQASKSQKKIDKKIWQQMLNDAQTNLEDGITSYQFIYVETHGKEHLQSIASEASSGIGFHRIKAGELQSAIDGLLQDIGEIEMAFVSPKLLLQLASAYLLKERIPSAALIGLFGLLNKPGQHCFELLMLHITENYQPQMQALNIYLSSFKTNLSQLNVRELAALANNLNIEHCPIPDSAKIAFDRRRYEATGAICLDDTEKQAKLSSELSSRLEKALRLLRTDKFTEAANIFRDTLQFDPSNDDKIVLLYAQAMSLLASKSLENVKEGHALLREMDSDSLRQQLPAIVYGLAKYELALNETDPQYLHQSLNVSEAEGISGTCKSKLEDFFIELKTTEAVKMLEKLKVYRPQILATCRYEECQKLSQGRQSILQWKGEICLQDLDFKGYYHLTCTEKCRIDFHPWCWKHKKDQEVKKDKDYLQEWCLTPDCKAPFCKITVVKDNPDQPIEISDKRITEKMLEKGRKSADNATVSTPGGSNENRDTVKKDLKVENPVIIVQDESQQKLIDALKGQIEQIKTNEKLLTRQNRNLAREKEDADKKVEEAKDTSKRLISEKKFLQSQMDENMQKNASLIDKQRKDISSLKNEVKQTKLNASKEKFDMLYEETKSYQNFVGFMNEHLLLETEELPKLFTNLDIRADAAATAQPGNNGALQSLLKIPKEPNYDDLRREILNQPTFATTATSASTSSAAPLHMSAADLSTPPPAAASSPAKKKPLIQQIIDGVIAIYPDLKQDQLWSMIMEIKKQNNNTLKNLSMNQILDKVSELKDKYDCAICMCDMLGDKNTRLECGHEFHSACVDPWIQQNRTCPMCRNLEYPAQEYPQLQRRRAN